MSYDYHIRVECNCCDETPLDEIRQFPNIKAAWDAVIEMTARHNNDVWLASVHGPEK